MRILITIVTPIDALMEQMIQYPDLSGLPAGRVYSFVVLETITDIHTAPTFMKIGYTPSSVAECDFEQARIVFEETGPCKVLACFLDNDDANEFVNRKYLEAMMQYTTFLNKLTNSAEVRGRTFLAFLDKEISLHPGCYEMGKEDYLKLKSHYSQLRLATNEEMRSVSNIYNCFIAQDFELVKKLKLQTLHAVRVVKISVPFENVELMIPLAICQSERQRLTDLIDIMVEEEDIVTIEDAIYVMKEICPELDAKAIVENLLKCKKDMINGVESEPVVIPMSISFGEQGKDRFTVYLESC